MSETTAHTMITGAALFPGGGGVERAWRALGIAVLHSYEIDDDIASVARVNGFDTRTGDVLREPVPDYGRLDCLHASPPCPSFSPAKTNSAETPLDLALAERVCDYIEALHPGFFTLENVWGYCKSQSWAIIQRCLQSEGYAWSTWHLNMADYGIAQSRKRMIVAAVRGARCAPARPPQTHAEDVGYGGGLLFPEMPTVEQWVSWYEAIEDLLPGLPDSQLAPWQLCRLPKEYEALLFLTGNTSDVQAAPGVGCQQKHKPAGCVHAHSNGSLPRAILIKNGDQWTPLVEGASPAPSVTNTNGFRAVLLDSQNAGHWGKGYRNEDEPAHTLHRGELGRAVLIGGQTSHQGRKVMLRVVESPAFSVVSSHVSNLGLKAIVGCRVVQLTPRCLARFQGVEDDYILPESNKLACQVLGNMVPPPFMQQLYKHLLWK